MAAETYRGITYTTSAGAIKVVLDLPLWAGVDQDDSSWLGGTIATGGATAAYPGALTGFTARQTDGSQPVQPRLVVCEWSTATNDATLTLSGECTDILVALPNWKEACAAPGLSQHVSTAIAVDDNSHWLVSEATNAVDGGEDAYAHYSVGDQVLDANGALFGFFKSATASPGPATTLTLDANATVQINDNGLLHKRTPLILKNTSGTTQSLTLLLLVA